MAERIVLTGGSGDIASSLRPHLAAPGRRLVLLDLVPPAQPLQAAEEHVTADVTDQTALEEAFAGADLVVHLAGHRSERPWPDIAAVNIGGTQAVLEAARRTGVRRVLLASSIHAVGASRAVDVVDEVEPAPHPDTYYGVSKAAVEALGRLYGSRSGMSVVAARIGTAQPAPASARALSTWLSPGDAARLVEAVARLEEPGGHVVWAVSANTRRWVRHDAGAAVGFVPVDDAEAWAASLGHPDPLPMETLLGGAFTDDDHPVGGTW